jgi:hypothetical protein
LGTPDIALPVLRAPRRPAGFPPVDRIFEKIEIPVKNSIYFWGIFLVPI